MQTASPQVPYLRLDERGLRHFPPPDILLELPQLLQLRDVALELRLSGIVQGFVGVRVT